MKHMMRILVLSGLAAFGGQLSAKALSIARQGVFASGGTVTDPVPGTYDPTTNWQSLTREGNTAHVDHASVLYQIPSKERRSPMVFLHGYGQTRTGWMTTPDGREGWSDMALRNNRSVFLVDQPRRGEAASTVRMTEDALDIVSGDPKAYLPGDQAWYTHFRIGRVAPERYAGSQFPAGEEAQNQFFRQMTPNAGSYDERLFGSVLGEVLADVRKMTDQKVVYVTHSQGGRVGWQTDTANMAALVAIEPGGTPEVGSETYRKFVDAKIPMVIIFGDNIDNGPTDIQSTAFWKAVRDQALDFARHYNADGAYAEVWDLPKMGMTGNSHFLFQEMNNRQIYDLVEGWLRKRGL